MPEFFDFNERLRSGSTLLRGTFFRMTSAIAIACLLSPEQNRVKYFSAVIRLSWKVSTSAAAGPPEAAAALVDALLLLLEGESVDV